jgi:hypothetical protein
VAVYCYNATCIPTEWILLGLALVVAGPILVFVLMRRRAPDEGSSPIEARDVILVPVDDNGTLQMGELLTGVERTEDTLMFSHPDWVDEEGAKYFGEVPIDKEVPERVIDADKNVHEIWHVAKRGEDLEIISASAIVNKLKQRFDALPANPRKVGRFYVGWPFGKQSGLQSLISSTSGKILAFGGVALIFYLMGILSAAANHLGFTH